MSQIIVDEHLGLNEVLLPIQRWTTAQKIEDIRPGEVIKDDRLLVLLTQLKKSTFVTIDDGFWNKRHRDPRYCIVYFAIPDTQQNQISYLLRRLFRFEPFKTKSARMGKVVRITPNRISYWQAGVDNLQKLAWLAGTKRRK